MNPSGSRHRFPHGQGSEQGSGESGSISVLVIGFTAIILLILGVLTAMTSIHIERQRLYALADSASQAAADTYSARSAIGSGRSPELTSAQASAAAAQTVSTSEHPASLESVSVGADEVSVRLSGTAHPPLVGFLVPDGIQISVESAARLKQS